MFWIIIIAIIFIALGTLHYRIGIDTIGYERFYDNLKPLNYIREKDISSSRFAPGFILLSSLCKLISPDIVLLNFVYSTFVCGVATWFLYKHTKHIFFALLMFFFFCFTLLIFEQIREAIAVGFFLIAWQFFVKKQWVYWYIISFVAIMFHTSASFMFILPLILLPGIKEIFVFGKRTYIICAGVLVLAFILQTSFSQYIKLLAVTQSMEEMTKGYANTAYVEGNLNFIGILGQIVKSVLYPLIALACLSYTRKENQSDKSFRTMEMFTIISVYISLLSIGVPIIVRYNNYFFFFPIVLISDWVYEFIKIGSRKLKLNFAYWSLFLFPMFLMQFTSYLTNVDRGGKYKNYMIYYPFTTHIDKDKDQNKERAIKYARRRM